MRTRETLGGIKYSIAGTTAPSICLSSWRAICRLFAVCIFLVIHGFEWLVLIGLNKSNRSFLARAAWMNRGSRRLLRLIGLEPTYLGEPPPCGLLVCNHLSYVDVIALAARSPVIFVAKREVQAWPGLGKLATCAGTIFIDRRRPSDVVRVGEEIKLALSQRATVCLFAEGTSSAGAQVLPFHSSLLQPAVARAESVSFARISYDLHGGCVAEEVCYWGDMIFGPHIFNLLSKRCIVVRVQYGQPVVPGSNRKQLAVLLQSRVAQLGHTFQ